MKVRANDNVCEELNGIDAINEVEDSVSSVEISSNSVPSGEDNRQKGNNYGFSILD